MAPLRALPLLSLLGGLVTAQEPAPGTRLPFAFERNDGQTDAAWSHVGRAPGYTVLTADDAFVVRVAGARAAVFRFAPVAAAPSAPVGEEPLPGVVNHLRGTDPADWVVGVPRCARVRYPALWAGVDLVLRAGGAHLEYDVELAPGVDPRVVEFAVAGGSPELAGDVLRVVGPDAVLEQAAPIAFQVVDGERREVPVRYELRGPSRFGFALGDHDPTLPLVVDPVVRYATWLGGSNWDYVLDVAVDPTGNAYVVGQTASADLPAAGNTIQGVYDAFVAKLDPTGSQLVWATYLGGSGAVYNQFEAAVAVAVDAAQEPVLLGYTDATDFPVTPNATQPANAGGYDAFVCRLASNGASLVFSTYLGGSGRDLWSGFASYQPDGGDVVLDGNGSVTVVGGTQSTDFPLAAALQQPAPGRGDAFVASYTRAGARIQSTLFGGGSVDLANTVDLGPGGLVLISGLTDSADLPVSAGAWRPSGRGPGFVTLLDPAVSQVLASTFFPEVPRGARFDPTSGDVYVAGATADETFPRTAGAMVHEWPGAADRSANAEGFLSRLDLQLTRLVWSTLVGVANQADGISDLRVDPNGYPVALLHGSLPRGGIQHATRVCRLTPDGRAWCTEQVCAVGSHSTGGLALLPGGSAWVAGHSHRTGTITPTAGAFRSTIAGQSDAFVVRVDERYSGLAHLGVGATAVRRGAVFDATVTIDGPAPAGGVTVALGVSPVRYVQVPSQVTIPAGASHATFRVTVALAATPGAVTVDARLAGATVSGSFEIARGPTHALRWIGAANSNAAAAVARINDDGVTVGQTQSGASGGAYRHADATGLQSIGAIDATDISANGSITGAIGYQSVYRLLPGSPLQTILTSSAAAGINDRGDVVGSTTRFSSLGYSRAFWWSPGGGIQNLGTLGGSASQAMAVNAHGQVVGESFDASGARRAFSWQLGTPMIDLGVLPGHVHSVAYGINDHGEVCGISADQGFSAPRAFRHDGTSRFDLGVLPGDGHSLGRGINEHGQVVGFSARRGGAYKRAMLHTPTTGMVELAELVDPAERVGWTFEEARSINVHGQIVGVGRRANGSMWEVFRLDPIAAAAYGGGCRSSSGRTPVLAGEGRPAAGEDFALVVAGGPAHASAVLLLGGAPTRVPIAGACDLLVANPVAAAFALGGDGRARIGFRLPATMMPGSLFTQAFFADPRAPGAPISATNGLEVRVQ